MTYFSHLSRSYRIYIRKVNITNDLFRKMLFFLPTNKNKFNSHRWTVLSGLHRVVFPLGNQIESYQSLVPKYRRTACLFCTWKLEFFSPKVQTSSYQDQRNSWIYQTALVARTKNNILRFLYVYFHLITTGGGKVTFAFDGSHFSF